MKIRILPLFIFIFCLSAAGRAQSIQEAIQNNPGHFVYRAEKAQTTQEFFTQLDEALSASPRASAKTPANVNPTLSWTTSESSKMASAHQRFRQTFNNLPVLGATIIVHEKGEMIHSANGRVYLPQALASAPALPEHLAQRTALDLHSKAAAASKLTKAKVQSSRLLYVDATYPNHSGALRLAYEIEVSTARNPDGKRYYIDAETRRSIAIVPLVMHTTEPGTVQTQYYGLKSVPVTRRGANSYLLQDEERELYVVNGNGDAYTSNSSDFTSSDERFGRMAFDIYYGIDRFYELLDQRYDWQGVDGEGMEMSAVATDSPYSPFVNAYWNGSQATFGQGDCYYLPLTTIDVVAHEFAHGVTEFSSALVYDGQSGALNESFSDICGKALEYITDRPNFSWTLGNRFAPPPYAEPFRSMQDPTLYEDPKVVGGEFWQENNGVHTNSGPLNHWFYLLTEGGSGTNDLGLSYQVRAMGIDTPLAHAFELNTGYLFESSSYADAYSASLLLAEAAYGAGSSAYRNIQQAWRAIGVVTGGGGSQPASLDVDFLFAFSDAICAGNQGFEIQILAQNKGATLPAGAPFTLTVARKDVPNSAISSNFTLENETVSGDYIFQMLEVNFSILPADERLEITLNFLGDEDPDNNKTDIFFDQLSPTLDLAIELDTDLFEPCSALGSSVTQEYVISNKSCVSFSGQATLSALDANNNVLLTRRLTLELSSPTEGDYNDVDYEYLEIPSSMYSLVRKVQLSLNGDSKPENNSTPAALSLYRNLTPGTTLRFDDVAETAFYGIDSSGFYNYLELAAPKGNPALLATGSFNSLFEAPCNDPRFVFNEDDGLSSLLVCIDNTGSESKALRFDATSYHGDPSSRFTELDQFRQMIGVTFYENEELIYQREFARTADGVTQNMETIIPANFVGIAQISFQSGTGLGREWVEFDSDLSVYDYWLLDNLTLASPSSIQEVVAKLRLSPNPTKEGFTVNFNETGAQTGTLDVFDALGRKIYTSTSFDGYVATASWQAGIYTVLYTERNGERQLARVVVE